MRKTDNVLLRDSAYEKTGRSGGKFPSWLYILLLIIFIYYFLTLLFSLSLCVYVCTMFHSLVTCHELVFTFISINAPTLRNIPNLLLWNNHTMLQWRGKIDAFPNTQPLNGSGLGAYDVERSLSAYEFRKSDRRCPLVRLLIFLALSFKRGILG